MISIIIPIYNSEKYLRKCLDCIVEQTYKDWECILVDDGSKDNSSNICDEYVQKDTRFKVIHKTNEGVSASRNEGINRAKGEWIYFCDSDDRLYDKYSLEKLVNLTDGADLVAASYEPLDDEDRIAKELEKTRPFTGKLDSRSFIEEHMVPKLEIGYMGFLWNKLFKREIIVEEHLRFDAKIYYAEDFLFILQYVTSKKCHIIAINNLQKVYCYYQHVGSAMASFRKEYNPKFFTDFIAYEHMVDIVHNRYCDPTLDRMTQYRCCVQGLWHLDMMQKSHFADTSKIDYIQKRIQQYGEAYKKAITKNSLKKMKVYALTLPLNKRVLVTNEYLHSKNCHYKYLEKKWKIAWLISHIAGEKGLWLIRHHMNFNSGK